jgi:hypothetical protein
VNPERGDMSKKEPKVRVMTVERHILLTEKACPRCRKQFMGTKWQKYCSKRCSNLAAYWRNPDAYRESRMKSYRKQRKQTDKKK